MFARFIINDINCSCTAVLLWLSNLLFFSSRNKNSGGGGYFGNVSDWGGVKRDTEKSRGREGGVMEILPEFHRYLIKLLYRMELELVTYHRLT